MSTPSGAADTIYVNGKVWTGNSHQTFEQALAVEGDRIVAVGSNERIRRLAGDSTETVDLDGFLVTPGIIDTHTHFVAGALAQDSVALRDADTPAEFARRIAERAARRPGEWILDGKWDHELWDGQLPRREWIDDETADTPVFVLRLDGHMGLANSAALKLAGIDSNTIPPEGGEIIREESGEPTGLLKDTAMDAVFDVIPAPGDDRIQAALQLAFDKATSVGVTQIHDMGDGTWRALHAFRRAKRSGRLGIRIYAFVPIADWSRMSDFVRDNGRGDDWLRWGGVKGFVDGSIGSSTAWFYEPYADDPDNSGLTMVPLGTLAQQIADADRAGLHLAIHAIGDRANDWLLDTFDRVMKENGPRDRRFRIEHAQHLRPSAQRRYAELGITAAMQPYHAIDDGRWAEKRIGAERLKGTYAFRSLLDTGTRLSFGSDWDVAPLNPMTGVDAAVNRRTIDGENPRGWQPQERIRIEEAMQAYTTANAYAGFQDGRLGKLMPGYLADFVVWSDDIFAIDPDQRIADVVALRTVIGGKTRYLAPEHHSTGLSEH